MKYERHCIAEKDATTNSQTVHGKDLYGFMLFGISKGCLEQICTSSLAMNGNKLVNP